MAIQVFGLTGGIASGKSAVAARWQQCNLPVVDADELAREVVRPGQPGLDAVIQLMGQEVLNSDGSLNRSLVASRVFGNEEKRRALEVLIHPLIHSALESRMVTLDQLGEPLLCYEASLLIENGRAHLFRPLVVVAANQELQVQRAAGGHPERESDVRARIAAQLPMADKLAHADIVITNEGTLQQLHVQADKVLAEISRQLKVDPARYRAAKVAS